MDTIVDALASFSTGLRYDDLSLEVVHAAKRAVLDSIGCAFGAFDSQPARIARHLAEAASVRAGATVLGTTIKTTEDRAAFANGVMVRYLDYNDTYMGASGGGHPSDYIPAVLAAGEAAGANGRAVIEGVVVAYEIFCQMLDATRLGVERWDHVINGAIASAAASAKVMGLSTIATANAISIATVSNLALQGTRLGAVSMWKGCASADACRNGVFATLLAAEGLTGPADPFSGRGGFFTSVSGPFDAPVLAGSDRPAAVTTCDFKQYAAGYFAQTAVDAAIQAKTEIGSAEDIRKVEIGTSRHGRSIMAGDADKWHPTTRETADHSLPFVVASALVHGRLSAEDFAEDNLSNPRLLAILEATEVTEDFHATEAFPDATITTVAVTTFSGQRVSKTVRFHRGHHRNPMTDDELELKFLSQAKGLDETSTRDFIGGIWNLERLRTITDLLARRIVAI